MRIRVVTLVSEIAISVIVAAHTCMAVITIRISAVDPRIARDALGELSNCGPLGCAQALDVVIVVALKSQRTSSFQNHAIAEVVAIVTGFLLDGVEGCFVELDGFVDTFVLSVDDYVSSGIVLTGDDGSAVGSRIGYSRPW